MNVMRWLRSLNICIIVITLLVATSCIQHQDTNKTEKVATNSEQISDFRPKYAKGFLVVNDTLILRSPKDTTKVMQRFPLKNYQSFILQSTTHVPYLEIINPQLIKGCNFTDRIKSDKTKERIKNGAVEEMLSGSHFDYEKLLEINPDAILVYPFDAKEIKVLEEMNLNYILCYEYLEEGLLARAEWMKFFGLITGELELVENYFEGVEQRYLNVPKGEFSGSILLNLPFNDQWNVPSGVSPTVELLERAGFQYPWKERKSEGNIVIPKEEIIDLGMHAETWIIFAGRGKDFGLKDLIEEDELYAQFKCVADKNVVFCNTSSTPYFEEALIEPDVLLNNLIQTAKTGKSTKYFQMLK